RRDRRLAVAALRLQQRPKPQPLRHALPVAGVGGHHLALVEQLTRRLQLAADLAQPGELRERLRAPAAVAVGAEETDTRLEQLLGARPVATPLEDATAEQHARRAPLVAHALERGRRRFEARLRGARLARGRQRAAEVQVREGGHLVVAEPLPIDDRLPKQRPSGTELAPREVGQREREGDAVRAAVVAVLALERTTLLAEAERRPGVAEVEREHTRPAQSVRAGAAQLVVPRRRAREREQPLERGERVGGGAACEPVAPGTAQHRQGEREPLRVRALLRPLRGGEQVRQLSVEALQPELLRRPPQERRCALDELGEVAQVALAELGRLASSVEPLPRILADRVEQSIA